MSKRITGPEREHLANLIKEQYESGMPIRAIAEKCGRSYGFVHYMLVGVGVRLRRRGGRDIREGDNF